MSYFLNIYKCTHSDIENCFSEENAFINFEKKLPSSEEKYFMKKLLNKDFMRDPDTWESDEAPDLIRSLEKICKEITIKSVVIEFYLDEEELPELFSFSFDDWDVANDFQIPYSPYGTPSVVYRNQKSLIDYLKRFKAMKEEQSFNEEYIANEELNDLIKITSEVIKDNTGMFIFCTQ